jgi:hypothetical protein
MYVVAAVASPDGHMLHGRLGDEEAGTSIFERVISATPHCPKSLRADVGGGGVEECAVSGNSWSRPEIQQADTK